MLKVTLISDITAPKVAFFDSRSQGWHPSDARILHDQATMATIIRGFARTRHNFNVLVYPYGLPAFHKAHENMKKTFETKKSSDSINVIITNNAGNQNHLPFTPWIMAHRIGHAIEQTSVAASAKTVVAECLTKIVRIFSKYHSIDPVILGFEYNNRHSLVNLSNSLLLYIFTMKSARRDTLVATTEIFAELMAQYIIKDAVKLNTTSRWRVELPHHLLQERDLIDSAICSAENIINEQFAGLLDSLVGKTAQF